jgi:hypothetical protein
LEYAGKGLKTVAVMNHTKPRKRKKKKKKKMAVVNNESQPFKKLPQICGTFQYRIVAGSV